jgi:anti-sigma regulatory factor (Ser/Thr protein kinase)
MTGPQDPEVRTARWIVPARKPQMRPVRREAMKFARLSGMPQFVCHHVGTAVSEAMANAARHAYPQPPHGCIVVDAATDGTDLTVIVSDTGTGEIGEPDYAGRGVRLMMAVSDRFEIWGRPGEGTSVLMEFGRRDSGR